mmetsp:Transcript_44291/g.87840  ORF Transcript_44291/g.87840 Transcript_44291/m.87840 type:complete len:457 (+) Transcript_44291:77-1447(+)
MKCIVFWCLVAASPWTTQAETGLRHHKRAAKRLRQESLQQPWPYTKSLAIPNLRNSTHKDHNRTILPVIADPIQGNEKAVRDPVDAKMQRSPATVHTVPALEQIDDFTLCYWGTVLGSCILGSLIVCVRYGADEEGMWPQGQETSDRHSLYENIWALVLVAAVGKASFVSKGAQDKRRVPVGVVAAIVTVLCGLQISAVLLIVGSINPNADPLTKKPASPWLQHTDGHTVNAMKVIMTIFLGASQIGEISQCRRLAVVSWNVKSEALIVHRLVPMLSAMMQYCVALSVVWSGVAVILSFATCLDIVYSSMSVVFITSGDEMFFDMFEEIFDVESDFDVLESHKHSSDAIHQRRVNTAMPINPRGDHGSSSSDDGEGTASVLSSARSHSSRRYAKTAKKRTDGATVDWDEPIWLWALLKFLTVFPGVWAFGILGRAMYTGVMPLHRLQHTFSYFKVV